MKHKITNGNINHERVENNIISNFPNGLDFCYTDPPWGNGNLKYWATINEKMAGVNTSLISQDELENRFVSLIANYVNNYAFIVYGKKEKDSVIEKFKKLKNIKDIQQYPKRYNSGSKLLENWTICITLNDAPIIDYKFLENTTGIKSLEMICEMFKNKYHTCLELFIGVGYYLKILNKYGFTVCGNELNPERLKKALAKV